MKICDMDLTRPVRRNKWINKYYYIFAISNQDGSTPMLQNWPEKDRRTYSFYPNDLIACDWEYFKKPNDL
jgi:hypothetical protein